MHAKLVHNITAQTYACTCVCVFTYIHTYKHSTNPRKSRQQKSFVHTFWVGVHGRMRALDLIYGQYNHVWYMYMFMFAFVRARTCTWCVSVRVGIRTYTHTYAHIYNMNIIFIYVHATVVPHNGNFPAKTTHNWFSRDWRRRTSPGFPVTESRFTTWHTAKADTGMFYIHTHTYIHVGIWDSSHSAFFENRGQYVLARMEREENTHLFTTGTVACFGAKAIMRKNSEAWHNCF